SLLPPRTTGGSLRAGPTTPVRRVSLSRAPRLRGRRGGDEGIRTPYLNTASVALSRLSYIPDTLSAYQDRPASTSGRRGLGRQHARRWRREGRLPRALVNLYADKHELTGCDPVGVIRCSVAIP